MARDGSIDVKNLASMLSLETLGKNLKELVDKKFRIIELKAKDVSPKDISKIIGESYDFVDDTLRLVEVVKNSKKRRQVRPRTRGKRRWSNNPILWLSDLTASRIRNSLAWEWGNVLAILYAPLHSDFFENQESVFKYFNSQRTPDSKICPLKNKTKKLCLKPIFARGVEKLYSTLTKEQLKQFLSLLTVHPYILEGTLPDKFYGRIGLRSPKYSNGKRECELSPGCAWSHNISRKTHESNCRMFYEIFMGGFDRKNEKHKIIRRRAARVWLLRRIIRRIKGKVQKPKLSDSQTREEYMMAVKDYKWKKYLKKTGPVWKQELLHRWSLNPSCE
jgi:hypothetical protein